MKRRTKGNVKYSKKNNDKSSSLFILFPIIFVISILPFIMRHHIYDAGLSKFAWFPSSGLNQDIFLYYKQILFIIMSSLMLLILGIYIYNNKKDIKIPYFYTSLVIYGLFSLLSTIFSKHYRFGLTGMFDHFESLFVLLGYCIVVIYVFIFVKTEKDIKKIFKYLLISITIMNIVGLSQLIGKDIVTSEFAQQMIFPREIWENLENFSVGFEKGTIYLTLFNPNYVGVYIGLLLPIIFTVFILNIGKMNKKDTILYSVNVLGFIMCLYGSGSTSAIVGIAVAFIFLIILLWSYLFKNKYVGIGIIGFVLTASVIIVTYRFDAVKKIIPLKSEVSLNEITTTEQIEIIYNNNKLYIDYEINSFGNITFIVLDEYKAPIEYAIDIETGYFVIQDERFQNIKFISTVYSETLGIKLNIENKDWEFVKEEDGNFYYLNRFMRLDKIKTAESTLFKGYERFASGRGYIWSRTIPLLKKYMFLGSGADTFVIAFPQQDYVNLYNYGFSTGILTKPHNLYLQIGVQTGLISLLAFILFYLSYFFNSLKLYFKCRYTNTIETYGIAIFIGTISYMIIGLSNDSSITVSPIYWALVGIGISINYRIKTSENNQ